jgi:hypothetical protein
MTRDQLLKAVNTRELLKAPRWSGDSFMLSRLGRGGALISYKYGLEEIRAELALRPHVPNKNESRGLRMQRKKQGRGR